MRLMEIPPPKIHDLDSYRMAIEVVKDLESFLKELDLFLRVCYPLKRYKFVAVIWDTAYNSRTILKSQLEYYRRVEKNRGADKDVEASTSCD